LKSFKKDKNKDKENNLLLAKKDSRKFKIIKKGNKDENKTFIFKSLFGKKLPVMFNKKDKKIRKKTYIKEALFLAGIITIIDIIGIYKLKFMNIIVLFDNNIFNFILTIILTFIVLFVVFYYIDFMITEKMIKSLKRKK